MQTRLEGLTLHCSNSPIPARMEEFQDLKLISRLSFVPHPNIPPPGLAGLSQRSILQLPLLEHPHFIRNGLLRPGVLTWHCLAASVPSERGDPKPGLIPGAGSVPAGMGLE